MKTKNITEETAFPQLPIGYEILGAIFDSSDDKEIKDILYIIAKNKKDVTCFIYRTGGSYPMPDKLYYLSRI